MSFGHKGTQTQQTQTRGRLNNKLVEAAKLRLSDRADELQVHEETEDFWWTGGVLHLPVTLNAGGDEGEEFAVCCVRGQDDDESRLFL